MVLNSMTRKDRINLGQTYNFRVLKACVTTLQCGPSILLAFYMVNHSCQTYFLASIEESKERRQFGEMTQCLRFRFIH